MFQHLTKEALSGFPISSASHKDIDHVPILIDCSPQVVALGSTRRTFSVSSWAMPS